MEEIRFSYESSEIRGAVIRHLLHDKLILVLFFWGYWPMMLAGAVAAAVVKTSTWTIAVSFGLAVVWLLVNLSWFVSVPRKFAAQSRERPFAVRLVARGIEVEHGPSAYVIGLPDIARVDETAAALVIHHRPQGFLVLPRRAFRSDAELQGFLDQLRPHVRTASASRSGYGAVVGRLAMVALVGMVGMCLVFVVIYNLVADPEPSAEMAAQGAPDRPTPDQGFAREAAPARGGGVDPLLLAVCAAHDEVVVEGVPEDRLLQAAAIRAVTRHGVTEAQLAELGARPAELLASIRRRGSPPECGPMIASLEARLEEAAR